MWSCENRMASCRSTERVGFTMVELLVTMSILMGLVMMVSALYSSYVREADVHVLKQNLSMIRAAIQHFYLDHGRYPIHGRDLYGNQISFLDGSTSELVQGAHNGANSYPKNRIHYLAEIPIDPTTNLVNWKMLKVDNGLVNPGSQLTSKVVTNVVSSNPEFSQL